MSFEEHRNQVMEGWGGWVPAKYSGSILKIYFFFVVEGLWVQKKKRFIFFWRSREIKEGVFVWKSFIQKRKKAIRALHTLW